MLNFGNKNKSPVDNSYSVKSSDIAYQGNPGVENFTQSYVPEDEGTGYTLGYLSIVFGLLFNIIGIVLGFISIVRGIKNKKVILSLLGVVGIIAGALSVWLYIQAFYLILPGVTYDSDSGQWIIEQEETDFTAIDFAEDSFVSSAGERFGISLPVGFEHRSFADNTRHVFYADNGELSAIEDLTLAISIDEFIDEMSTSDIREYTNEVLRQEEIHLKESGFDLIRGARTGLVPDTIETVKPIERQEFDHGYFTEILKYKIRFSRLTEQQVATEYAVIKMMYSRDHIVLLAAGNSMSEPLSSDDFMSKIIGSVKPK